MSEERLDVRRVVQAITNIAKRHGIGKVPAQPVPLMHIYGYSRATPDMDAEIVTEYARLAQPDAPRMRRSPAQVEGGTDMVTGPYEETPYSAADGRLRTNVDGSPCWCERALGHTADCARLYAEWSVAREKRDGL